MKPKVALATYIPLACSAAIGALTYLFTGNAPDSQRFSFAIAVSAALLHLYALVLFVRGFRYFKRELRVAYAKLSTGIAALGLAISQLSVVNLFQWIFWVDIGAILLLYVAAVIPMFLGVRQFTKSLAISSRWVSLPIVSVAAMVLGIALAFVPHAASEINEITFRASMWLTIAIAVFFVACARGVVLIRQKAGTSYTDSLSWLLVAFVAATIAAIQFFLELVFTASRGWYTEWSIVILSFNITGWLFMRAGYAFSIVGQPSEKTPAANAPVTSIDIIIYTEGLASNAQAINPIIDGLRFVTARMKGANSLTQADQTDLLKTYLKLEDYLVTSEPLRKLTRQEVRQYVEHDLGISPASTHTFWPQLPPLNGLPPNG